MFGEHPGAGAGGGDHVVIRRKSFDGLKREVLGEFPVAGIIGRLAAAGLRWHLDRASGVLEELDRRPTDRGAEKVDKTSDKEPDARLF